MRIDLLPMFQLLIIYSLLHTSDNVKRTMHSANGVILSVGPKKGAPDIQSGAQFTQSFESLSLGPFRYIMLCFLFYVMFHNHFFFLVSLRGLHEQNLTIFFFYITL
jgi:hypothetical protein